MCVYVVHVCVRFILYLVVYMIGGACGACVVHVCVSCTYMCTWCITLHIYLVVHLMFSGACVCMCLVVHLVHVCLYCGYMCT